MREYKIYVLKDPNNLKVRYIGVTVRKLNQRLSQHIHDAKNNKGTHKVHWIKKLLNNNQKPIIELLEICNEKNWQEREIYWIGQFENLTNTREGGAGIIFKPAESFRKNIEQRYKPIVQLDLDCKFIQEFQSIKEASEKLNIYRGSIENVLNKWSKTAQGFHFVYKKYYIPDYKIQIIKRRKTVKKNTEIKVIYNCGKELIFSTLKETALYLKVSSALVAGVINKTRNIGPILKNVKNILRYSLDSIEI